VRFAKPVVYAIIRATTNAKWNTKRQAFAILAYSLDVFLVNENITNDTKLLHKKVYVFLEHVYNLIHYALWCLDPFSSESNNVEPQYSTKLIYAIGLFRPGTPYYAMNSKLYISIDSQF
jgi:hypothetical protein